MGALGSKMVIYLFVVSSDELIFSVSGNTDCDKFFYSIRRLRWFIIWRELNYTIA